jgi:hypothetical protein
MVTWQGSAPRSRTSPSSVRRRSSQAAASPDDEQEHAAAEEAAEEAALLVPGRPGAADRELRRAERLRADQLLVEAVLDQGLNGSRHRALEHELITYAVPVLQQLLADGRLVSKATQLGAPPASPDAWLYFTEEDRREFAHDMIASALPRFTKVVFEERRWTPGRGASLKTYFVNACILKFARLQAQWLDYRRAVRPSGLEFDPDAFASAADPAATVIIQDEVRQLLSKIKDDRLRETMVLRGAGWTAENAARAAGMTPKSAEGKLARLRKDLKEERAGTEPRASRSDTAQGGR